MAELARRATRSNLDKVEHDDTLCDRDHGSGSLWVRLCLCTDFARAAAWHDVPAWHWPRFRCRTHRHPSGRNRTCNGFTIVSITLSLIAVFIPLFLMSGYVGLLFREFAVTVSVALVLSLLISLTLTPMMCAYLLKPESKEHGWLYRFFERGFDGLLNVYEAGLKIVLRHLSLS
jgi:hypothetical protein